MKTSTTAVLAGLALAAVSSCGSQDEAPSAQPATKSVEVSGGLRVKSLGSINYSDKQDKCLAAGDLGDLLNPGAKGVVVISDPSGKEVGLLDIDSTEYETYEDKGDTYVSLGICVFKFSGQIPVDPATAGVFKATIPTLNVDARFELSNASDVKIAYPKR